MTGREKNEAKDRILEMLKENPRYKGYLSEQLQVKEEAVVYFLEEMIEAKLASLPIKNGLPTHMGTYVPIAITDKGKYFLEIDGGYTALYKKELAASRWNVAKTFAAILNAVAIIAIGAFSLPYFSKTNDTEKEVKLLREKVEALEVQVSNSNAPKRLEMQEEVRVNHK